MKPAPFEFVSPGSSAEALALLARYGEDVRVLAGGQSLVPMLNLRLVQPAVLMSINGCPDLDYVQADGNEIRIGALTRQMSAERSDMIRQRVPLLATVLPWLGGTANRNRGTVCGSLAHADPLAELPATALALNATMVIARQGAERQVSADEFFLGPLTTAIQPGEMLVEVRFPQVSASERFGFEEVSNRAHGFAVAAVMVRLDMDPTGICRDARIAAVGAGSHARRLRQSEALLLGQRLDEKSIRDAADCARREADPPGDIHSDAEYRRDALHALVRRVLTAATVC